MRQRASQETIPVVVMLVVLLAASVGCRQRMADQPRYEVYEASRLFPDSMASRHPVAGTVSRESALDDLYRMAPESYPLEAQSADTVPNDYPFRITDDVLVRGRNRYDIFCSPCHGRAGYGLGIIVQRGLRQPPSFHSERLRAAAPSHFVQVITDGFGAMYSYAARVSPADRWAIAAYVQALQLSQRASIGAVPEDSIANLRLP